MSNNGCRRLGLIAIFCAWTCWSIAAIAQDVPQASQKQAGILSAGRVGQRQTRQQVAPSIEPMARINNRFQNRVQSRVHNRIDRYYDPRGNTMSPFSVAADQIKAANPRSRR